MILTNGQMGLLFRCVGGGPIDKAKIVMFGNELGTAEGGGSTEATIESFKKDWTSHPVLNIGPGFVTTHIGALPVNSVFLQCVSRMALAIRYKEDRFFDSLTGQGKALLNKYIMEELYRTETAVINLKPLPQSTERHWDYENIDESRYLSMFNFTLLRSPDSPWKQLRLKVMKEAFNLAKNSLILGAGDRHNKKAFLELIYEGVRFENVKLENDIHIYVSKNPRIILSNYYSPYTGLGLDGLKTLYRYMADNKIV
jgi:hypothetical protein